MHRQLACALTMIAVVVLGGAHADPAPERESVPGTLSDIETGRLLLRGDRLEHAHAFLEQAKPGSEEERIERLFLLGTIELRLGMPEKAAERFEAILALRPDLTRVRLELAQAYYLAGRVSKARRSLRLSLADELPSSVEAEVERFLRRIDARRRWSASFGANLLPETRRPRRESVLIGGVPFRLDEEARTSSGPGVLLSGGVSFSPQLSAFHRGVFAVSAAAKAYERSSWNETRATAELGAARLLNDGSVSGGLRMGRVWTGGDPERTTLGPWTRLGWQVSGSTRIDVALDANRRRHDTSETKDGWRLAAAPRLAHAIDARMSLSISPVVEMVSASERHHASRLLGLGASASRAFRRGLAVTLGASAQIRRHRAPDPLFGRRRIDRTLRVSARLHHLSFRFAGFAPYVSMSIERSRSNISVHEYRIKGVGAGVARAF